MLSIFILELLKIKSIIVTEIIANNARLKKVSKKSKNLMCISDFAYNEINEQTSEAEIKENKLYFKSFT
jgi:hypothetical protein